MSDRRKQGAHSAPSMLAVPPSTLSTRLLRKIANLLLPVSPRSRRPPRCVIMYGLTAANPRSCGMGFLRV